MNQPTLSKHFIFNEKINADYLFSLYADDYAYIEEVFQVTLQHFDPDFELIKISFEGESLIDLRRSVHKMKPAFGFVGLTCLQEQCKQFEDRCEQASSTESLKDDYKKLIAALEEGKLTIDSEYRKLKDFNA